MPQYQFKLEYTFVESGENYEEAFKAALARADALDAGGERIVLREGEGSFIGDATGVFCEGCDGHTIPGVRWPTSPDGYTDHDYVERCDNCQRYESDDEAHLVVIEEYEHTGAAVYAGVKHGFLFVDVR